MTRRKTVSAHRRTVHQMVAMVTHGRDQTNLLAAGSGAKKQAGDKGRTAHAFQKVHSGTL